MDVGLSLKSCHPAALQSDGPKDPHQQIYGAAESARTHTHTHTHTLLCRRASNCVPVQPAPPPFSHFELCVVLLVNAARVLGCRRATFGMWCQLTAVCGEGTGTHGRAADSPPHLVLHPCTVLDRTARLPKQLLWRLGVSRKAEETYSVRTARP